MSLSLISCGALRTSNGYMSNTKDITVKRPENGRALIVFERENVRAGEWFTATIWEITQRQKDPKLVGCLHSTMKFMTEVDPGEHYFMAILEGKAELLKANIVGNKIYYVLMKMGVESWSSVSYFSPIKKGQDNPIKLSNFSILNSNAFKWEQENLQSAREHMQKVYDKWDKMSEKEKAKRSLNSEDGR